MLTCCTYFKCPLLYCVGTDYCTTTRRLRDPPYQYSERVRSVGNGLYPLGYHSGGSWFVVLCSHASAQCPEHLPSSCTVLRSVGYSGVNCRGVPPTVPNSLCDESWIVQTPMQPSWTRARYFPKRANTRFFCRCFHDRPPSLLLASSWSSNLQSFHFPDPESISESRSLMLHRYIRWPSSSCGCILFLPKHPLVRSFLHCTTGGLGLVCTPYAKRLH